MTSLELGGPSLADPKTIMSMSPLTSRSSTPPTPLTGLTIPSPGPGDDFKSIPLPPSPSGPKDLPETPIEDVVVQPADIPLPPSPKSIKQGLPFRRPRISNPLDRVVSSTQRTSSGRRVSSALQYAMHPDADPDTEPETAPDDSPDIDLAYYQQMVSEARSASDEEIDEIPTWDSSLGFGGQVPDLVGDEGIVGDADEAWMGYVRAQLNTLFPDYFDATAQEYGEGEGDVSISTIASSDLATPPIGTRLGPGMGVSRGVPNIRSEIGGLSEEIERLRGVVSGLAEGMRAAQQAPDTAPAVHEGDGIAPHDGEVAEVALPEDFLKVSPTLLNIADGQTAHLSMDIIRLIHTSLGGTACPDSELFSENNLTTIKHHLQVPQETADPEVLL
jgi:hypothetical protein